MSKNPNIPINAICPYYTMFPLSFPLRVLAGRKAVNGWVADPFCGRGTTNLAARVWGLPTFGIDSSPVAAAITEAKLAAATVEDVLREVRGILADSASPAAVPTGDFWTLMYRDDALTDLCKLREALLVDCSTGARKILRAIILGALHGPLAKNTPSYFSNQCPRTYAPKPAYAVKFWRTRGLLPPKVATEQVIRFRAERYLYESPSLVNSAVKQGDSRCDDSYPDVKVGLVVTSPPYYGMRTYVPDQWIRAWFLGGPSKVDYRHPADEICHSSPDDFATNLRSVWLSLAKRARPDARLVIRFGGINDRKADHVTIMKESLKDSGWRLRTMRSAGDADSGRRQASQFRLTASSPRPEHDFYAVPV